MSSLITSMEELKKVEMTVGNIENGVDNPNLLSVDSTSIIQTAPDEVVSDESKIVDDSEASKKSAADKAAAAKKKADEEAKAKAEAESKDPEVIAKKKAEDEAKAKAEADAKGKETNAVQKRIDELTKLRRTAERRAEFSEKKNAELNAEIERLNKLVPAPDKPKKADFEDESAYLEALATWTTNQKLKEKDDATDKKAKEDAAKKGFDETDELIDSIMEAGRTTHKDFNEKVLDENLKITPFMASAIIEAEPAVAMEIWYYLGSNPERAAEIFGMTPRKAAKAIEDIEVLVTKSLSESSEGNLEEGVIETEDKKTKEKKITNAPPPIVPVQSKGTSEKRPEDMTPREYRAYRERNKEK